jgi:hypothetical protein
MVNTYVLPNLPPALYKLAYAKPNAHILVPSLASSSNSSSQASGFSPTGTVGSGGTSSTLSSLATPGPAPTPTRQRGSHIANVNPDRRLTQLIDGGVKIKDLMGNDPPPLLDNGNQLCLSFLLRQGCWSTCRRANTHGHALTPAEYTRVSTYLTTQMNKLRTPTALPAIPP